MFAECRDDRCFTSEYEGFRSSSRTHPRINPHSFFLKKHARNFCENHENKTKLHFHIIKLALSWNTYHGVTSIEKLKVIHRWDRCAQAQEPLLKMMKNHIHSRRSLFFCCRLTNIFKSENKCVCLLIPAPFSWIMVLFDEIRWINTDIVYLWASCFPNILSF